GLDDEFSDLPDDEDESSDQQTDADEDLGADLDLGEDLLESLDDDDDPSDLSEEMSTKLELADAYIEMGDVRGAKELFDEIMTDGDDEQKAQAAKLADRIEGLN
ncbi:MAG: FimV/HubP family polar landmark protein, partial [Gammaproteobacteria bacterium]